MKKLFLLFVIFFFYLQAASLQTYQIQESQLLRLEAICQSYKANNQKLTEQLNDSMQESTQLRQQLIGSKQESDLLREQLLQERNLTQSLNKSLTKYETKVSSLEIERDNLKAEAAELKTEKLKLLNIIFILAGAMIIFIMTAVIVLLFRVKKIIRRGSDINRAVTGACFHAGGCFF